MLCDKMLVYSVRKTSYKREEMCKIKEKGWLGKADNCLSFLQAENMSKVAFWDFLEFWGTGKAMQLLRLYK